MSEVGFEHVEERFHEYSWDFASVAEMVDYCKRLFRMGGMPLAECACSLTPRLHTRVLLTSWRPPSPHAHGNTRTLSTRHGNTREHTVWPIVAEKPVLVHVGDRLDAPGSACERGELRPVGRVAALILL